MSTWDAEKLIDTASRYEALPSRERLGHVRSAVLRRSLAVGTGAVGSGLLAKGVALGSTTLGQVAVFASIGALAGGMVVAAASSAKWIAVQGATVAPEAAHGSAPRHAAAAVTAALAPLPQAPPLPAAPIDDRDSPVRIATTTQVGSDGRQRPTSTVPRSQLVSPANSDLEHGTSEPRGTLQLPLSEPSPPELTLPIQLDLLREMRSDLAEHRAAHALSNYRERAAIFRGSPLEPEARAAYIAALCQVGRAEEATREVALFRTSFPSSHLGDRLANGCGGESQR